MESEALYLKTIIKELDFLKNRVFIQWNAWKKKDLFLLSNKFIKKIPDLHNAKEHYP